MYFGKLGARFGRAPVIQAVAVISLATTMLGGADGLALASKDNSLRINHVATPANAWNAAPDRKLISGIGGARQWLSDGTLGWRPENQFNYSQELNSWSVYNGGSVAADQAVAPDGTTTADRITGNGSSDYSGLIKNFAAAIGTKYTESIYVKKDTSDWVGIITGGGYGGVYHVNLNTGAKGALSSTVDVVDVGNGWYRISRTAAITSAWAGLFIFPALADQSATGSGSVYAWGAQCERGNLSEYKPTTSSAFFGMRRDFDPRLASTVERCGYLIEEARTNLALRSEDFSQAPWVPAHSGSTSPVVTTNQAVAPDGTTTADEIVFGAIDNAAEYSTLQQDVSVGTASYVGSIFVKAASAGEIGKKLWLYQHDGAVKGVQVVTLTAAWQRVTSVASLTATLSGKLAIATLGSAYGGENQGTVTAHVWGAQMEAGSFASSYIPTAGSTVTRAADLVTLAGTLFPLSQTEGTLYAKYACIGAISAGNTVLGLDDTTDAERMFVRRNSTNTGQFTVVGGGAVQVNAPSVATIANLTQTKTAAGYKLNDSAVAHAGETVQMDNVCTMPTTTRLVFGDHGTGGRQLNGWLFEAAYFPTRKTNSQLQALASGYASDALLLMGAETQGLTFSATDQTMEIKDTTTPANNYSGELSAKLGSIATSGRRRYLSSGLLGWGPENLIRRSQEFDNVVWTTANDTAALPVVTANQATAPDGTMTADEIAFGAIAGAGHFSIMRNDSTSSAAVRVSSLYVKAKDAGDVGKKIHIYIIVGTLQDRVEYTLTADWQRISSAGLTSGANAAIAFGALGSTYGGANQAAFSCYVWGAQLEGGSTASTYKPTTSAAYYGLRLDYDSRLTGGPGYLVEEARTNLILRSQELENAAWTATDITVTANNTAAPDGTMTADLLTAGVAGTCTIQATPATVTVASPIAFSMYFKRGNTDWVFISLAGAGTERLRGWFNLSTGAVGTAVNIAPATGSTLAIQAAGNGFYRISVAGTLNGAGSTLTAFIANVDGDNSSTRVNNSTIYAWGAQLEAGAFATSYIPTTTATVTRATDLPALAATAFPDNIATGTLYIKLTNTFQKTLRPVISIGRNTFNDDLTEIYSNGTSWLGYVYNDSVESANVTIGAQSAAGNTDRVALAYAINDFQGVLNGVVGSQDTSGAVPNAARTSMALGGYGSTNFCGHIRAGAYYPRRFTNAQMQAIAA